MACSLVIFEEYLSVCCDSLRSAFFLIIRILRCVYVWVCGWISVNVYVYVYSLCLYMDYVCQYVEVTMVACDSMREFMPGPGIWCSVCGGTIERYTLTHINTRTQSKCVECGGCVCINVYTRGELIFLRPSMQPSATVISSYFRLPSRSAHSKRHLVTTTTTEEKYAPKHFRSTKTNTMST